MTFILDNHTYEIETRVSNGHTEYLHAPCGKWFRHLDGESYAWLSHPCPGITAETVRAQQPDLACAASLHDLIADINRTAHGCRNGKQKEGAT